MRWADCEILAYELRARDGRFTMGNGLTFEVVRQAPLPAAFHDEFRHAWETLPDGADFLCHSPQIGFEVVQDSEPQLRAAICVGCSNISMWTPQGGSFRTFEPESGEGRALVTLLEQALQ